MTGTRRERLMGALIGGSSVAEAAREVGIPRTTAHRMVHADDFDAELREHRADIVNSAIMAATGSVSRAVRVLDSIMIDEAEPSSVRVSAARALLQSAGGWVAIIDTVERVERLERLLTDADAARDPLAAVGTVRRSA
ncbi:hypothetical protein [Microbacterium capsulatum]|uniref:Helix-turn-helix domain-containing protein n=1 Tax=Microbacterium capsulatum TaxID=3041921 RepID=A0ABU0XBJ6_9MICO|nr:hypothetical protein [Microbacterium sp. ASV81]MDQ4212472.1 hypothetical protein [Microbacterium sp. ASV81]